MCASYGDDIEITHSCTQGSDTISHDPNVILTPASDQTLRDMRYEDHCIAIKGAIATCSICDVYFNTQDIINNALNRWSSFTGQPHPNIQSFQIPQHRRDIFAMRHMYDMGVTIG